MLSFPHITPATHIIYKIHKNVYNFFPVSNKGQIIYLYLRAVPDEYSTVSVNVRSLVKLGLELQFMSLNYVRDGTTLPKFFYN